MGYSITSVGVPFYLEWSNFISDGAGSFFLSRKIFQNNLQAGIKLTETDVESWFLSIYGAKAKLNWIDIPKSIATGHVDMAIRFVDCHRTIVASSSHPVLGPKLDAIADQLEDLGYKVTRIASALTEYEHEIQAFQSFRSYSSAAIVEDHVYVPKYNEVSGVFKKFDDKAVEACRGLSRIRLQASDTRGFMGGF